MEKSSWRTVILGDEFDDALRVRLVEAFRILGGDSCKGERLMGGSQEIGSYTVLIHGEEVKVEAETYLGLRVTGPTLLVGEIERMVSEVPTARKRVIDTVLHLRISYFVRGAAPASPKFLPNAGARSRR